MNDIRLGFAVFSVIVSVLVFGIWSNIEVYAQQASSNSSAPLASPQQHVPKIKITSPIKGQQVPVGKDLPIYGTSVGSNATSNNNDCKVSVIVNNVKPYQQANPGGTITGNYSKWNFVLTSKYTTFKPGQNKITAKYECASNPASKSFSSVNVTGVQDTSVAATSATTGAVSVDAPKLQQVALTAATASHSTGYITWATIASLSNSDNTSSSLLSSSSPSTSTIAPQATALRQQPQQPLIQVINTTGINDTSGQNYTFATISPTLASGKLMYLGYHGDSGGSSSSSSRSSGQSTAHSTSSNDKSSSSSDSKPSSHHSNTGSISDSAIEKKKTDSSSSKSHSTSTTTNVDSGSDAKSSSNSNTKSSSHTNHDTGSSSDLGSAIRNKVDSMVKNSIKRITDQIP